jgi:calcium-dependent protein kinase
LAADRAPLAARPPQVIGAGSFGTVREAVERSTGQRFAVKTVSKVPKRGPPTPRCGTAQQRRMPRWPAAAGSQVAWCAHTSYPPPPPPGPNPTHPPTHPPLKRYLLKLRAEVEVMQQLGVSLNAVYLADVFEDDVNIHMVMELAEG